MNRHVPTIKYSCLQGSFWMSFCVVINYAAVYLLSKGYTNSQVGIITAAAGLVSALLQPVIAGAADKNYKVTLRRLILILSILIILCAGILTIPGLYFLWYSLFYGIILATLQILTPLINAIGMECINHGISVNFGLARGIGSVSYAVLSLAAGSLIEHYSSTTVIPLLILLCYILVFASACMFRFHYTTYEPDRTVSVTEQCSGERKSFFASYKRFFILLAGISLLFVCHNMLNNYLFQIMTYHHGGSREMGIAAGIAAVLELPTMMTFTVIIHKISSANLLKISGIFFTLKAVLTFCAAGITGVYAAQTAQILGFALFIPASVYYTNSLIRPADRAKGQAFMTAANTAGNVLGSLLGGFLIDGKSVPAMLLTAAVISAVGMVFVFLAAEKCSDVL